MKNILKYVITLACAMLVSVAICVSRGIFGMENLKDVFHVLTDAFFVPGIMLLCFGLLLVAANGGTFDMLGYGVVMLLGAFKRDVKDRKYKDFYEYQQAKHSSKMKVGHFIWIGLAFVSISLAFLGFYGMY